jgi:hypothetical protein
MSADAATIKTARLRLRARTLADLEPIVAMDAEAPAWLIRTSPSLTTTLTCAPISCQGTL